MRRFLIFLKLDLKKIKPLPENSRDVTKIGHFGTGDFELTIKSEEDVDMAKQYIELSYQNIGGSDLVTACRRSELRAIANVGR